MKIAVAMSGGVDSSVSAALLVEQGHEVIGLAMKTHDTEPTAGGARRSGSVQNRSCCSPQDLNDARRVAHCLGIPFYVLNYTRAFFQEIVLPFAKAYRRGETPNPCVDCNDRIKFRPLLERAAILGTDALATGHYARIEREADRYHLRRGFDRHKDQAYFLYRLNQTQLARLLFPVGHLDKNAVRAHARRLGLPVADKGESQEICFVGEGGYADLVERTVGPIKGGEIVDGSGKILGEHGGVHRFTLGQRRGLRIAGGAPLYVTDIDAQNNQIRVGPAAELLTAEAHVGHVSWVGQPPADGTEVDVQQRYRETPKRATLTYVDSGQIRLYFVEPTARGAAGQAAVFYHDELVLGGGILRGAAA